jgi:exonuclease III
VCNYAGFTPNERKRFDDIVRSRGLVDAYRRLHGDVKDAMTWVGHPGVVAVGKYRGKGMRLDYFMVESAIAGRIDVCEQATDGTGVGPLAERPDAAFFGSDHCAVYMRLKEEEEEEEEEEQKQSIADPPPGLTNFVGACWPR